MRMASTSPLPDTPYCVPLLEYFPEGFHEPYYKAYLGWDFTPPMEKAGFSLEKTENAFLTKVNVWRKA